MLSIDRGLQFATENLLAERVRAEGAKAGYAIISDPETGEVLALANVEADPRTKVVGNTGNDLAVTSMYEPGSVNKVIALAAALEAPNSPAGVVPTGTGEAGAIDGDAAAGKRGPARKPQKGGGYKDAQG